MQGVIYMYVKKLGPSFPNNNYILAELYFGNDYGYTNGLVALYIPGWIYTAWYPTTFSIANAPDLFNRIKIVVQLYGTKDVEVFFDVLAMNRGGADPDIVIDNFEDTTVPVEEEASVPTNFKLFQNYPNPFNPETKIRFELSSTKFVKLQVFDALGREVETLVNEEKFPGKYEIQFNGSQLSSGIYYYQLIVGDFISTKKMQLIK